MVAVASVTRRVNVEAVYIWPDGGIGIEGNNILKGNISESKCIGGIRPVNLFKWFDYNYGMK